MIFYLFLFFCILIFTAVSFYNYLTAPRLEKLKPDNKTMPRISILIPVRNEEKNIINCLNKVFLMNYDNIEVIVYDDRSTDSTLELLHLYEKGKEKLKILEGKEKPEGWTGKSWACQNLYEASNSEILLFMDADVSISKSCLDNAAPYFEENDIALLSCFPKQKIESLGEWLVVPLMNWILLSLLPLRLVYLSKNSSLSAANGQFMLFKRKAYQDAGGHKAVKDKVVEDVTFAKIMKEKGYKVLTTVTRESVFCRMYNSYRESIKGFTKNFFPGFNMSKTAFMLFLMFLFAVFFLPFLLVFFDIRYLMNIVLILLLRHFVAYTSGQNSFLNIILHPFQMISLITIGISSMAAATKGNIYWKGRRI